MGVKKPDRRIADLTSQLHNAEEAWRKARADSNEAHKLLVEATQKLKEMIELCDRQKAELTDLRAVAAVVKVVARMVP
jgi:hypothetical protein